MAAHLVSLVLNLAVAQSLCTSHESLENIYILFIIVKWTDNHQIIDNSGARLGNDCVVYYCYQIIYIL